MLAQTVSPDGGNGLFGLVTIADAVRLTAYDALRAREKSWIKATLALAECAYGTRPAAHCTQSFRAEFGLTHICRAFPAAWALYVPGSGFASASRFAAAIMCARLAGLENVLAVWPQTNVPADSGALLAALELAGVEQAYTLAAPTSKSFWPELMDSLRCFGSDGRILYFGARDALYDALADAAEKSHLPFWAEQTPRLALDASDHIGAIDHETIRQTHPDTTLYTYVPGDTSFTTLYTEKKGVRCEYDLPLTAQLILGPGLEGCWLHADLSPDFFLTRQTVLLSAGTD